MPVSGKYILDYFQYLKKRILNKGLELINFREKVYLSAFHSMGRYVHFYC